MKIIKYLLLCLFIFSASNIYAMSTDGDWSDWFTYSGNVNHNNWREDLVTITNDNIRTINPPNIRL